MKKHAKSAMGCKCADLVNEELKKANARIPTKMFLDMENRMATSRPVFQLVLEKIDGKIKKPLPTVHCTYCPVCGKKLL